MKASYRVAAVARKTFVELTGWQRVLGFILAGLSLPVLGATSWSRSFGSFSVEMQTYHVVSNFVTMSVVWIAGLVLAFFVATSGAASIAREASEGSLLVLVAKPLARRNMIMGKLIAIVISALLLVSVTILLFALILWLILPITRQTLLVVLSAIPWLLGYSILVISLFGSISVAISALIRGQVAAMVVATAVVAAVLLAGSASHAVGLADATYASWHLYLLDGSYHLGNAFAPALPHLTGGYLLPVSQLQELNGLTGIFVGGRSAVVAYDNPVLGGTAYPGQLARLVSPSVSVMILMAVSLLALLLAVRRFERTDVH